MLVLGGARSGKSRYAQQRIERNAGELAFIATAQPLDTEMKQRIERHQCDRGPRWHTIDAPIDLVNAIADADRHADAILVDCVTLWLSNLILTDRPVPARELCEAISQSRRPVALVSNEVGCGIVPENSLARRFRDEAGRLNQQIAASADEVVMIVAGLPLILKP
ncbi:cobalamin biosynthesis protein [Croceicoccus naphthovorans]|uniref:Adenosylcobinamide kinase n=1 Tax=Croceicoccus naphthovorans TaxID=1348774 RepID=A0A0G3XKD6_9SPHN|nr:cobalamin biosynthesis protein [Croceicoccus naphthovorans]